LNPVEALENPAPPTVNAAVAFIADDKIEIPRRIIAVDVDHALQRGDGDLFFILKAATGAKHIGRIIRQMFGEGVFGLFRQGDAIHQEQDAGNGVRLEQPLDKRRRRAGLAGAGRHFDQQLAPPLADFAAQGVDAV
jgi:hypothetical protein